MPLKDFFNYLMQKFHKKKILFVSNKNGYLEHDLYSIIAESLLQNYHLTYLDADLPCEIVFKKNATDDEVEKRKIFDSYLNLFLPQSPVSSSPILFGFIKRIMVPLQQKWKITKAVKKVKPDLIIVISTKTYTYRVISKIRRSPKTLYIQPATLFPYKTKRKGWKWILKKFLYDQILGIPLIGSSRNFIESSSNAIFLFWAKVWVSNLSYNSNKEVHFIGNPLLDKLFVKKHTGTKNPRKRILVVLNKEANIGITNWDIYASFYKTLTKEFPQYEFLFKAHPLGDLERCKEVLEGLRVTVQEAKYEEIDLLLTHWSSMSLASIAHQVPTILVNPGGKFNFSNYHMQKYGAIVKSSNEFGRLANNFFSENSRFQNVREEFIASHLSFNDGKSLSRIQGIISSSIGN